MTKSNLSFRLAYYRNKHGYSQQDVAEKLNYSQQTIHKWENDQTKPDYQSLIKLADFYGVSLDELVGHEVKEKTSVYTNQELFLLDWVNSDEFNDIFQAHALSRETRVKLVKQFKNITDLVLKTQKDES